MRVSEVIGEALWEKFHHIPGCSVRVELLPVTRFYDCSLQFRAGLIRLELRFPEKNFDPFWIDVAVPHVCKTFEMLIKRDAPALLLACPPGP